MILKTESGLIKLQVIDDVIVRTVYTRKEEFSEPESLMVLPQSTEDVHWSITETEDSLRLFTSELELEVSKDTCAFKWRDSDGNTLVKEPPQGGKILDEVQWEDREAYSTKLELEFSKDEAIYGLGQHEEGVLNYRGNMQYLYQENMKVSLPAIVSTRGYGILWDSYSFSTFRDDQFGSYFWTEFSNEMDFYFVYGPEFDDIVSGFRRLTGRPTMFPKWAYGYVQSKERYRTQDELISTVEEYRDREIPLDCIVQDWHYWPEDTWGEKHFDPDRFPDPDGMTDELHSLNVELMISVWPNMVNGSDEEEMREGGFLLEDEDARDPFDRSTYDAFDENARDLYWKQADEGLFSRGVDAWWCDSTEPVNEDFRLKVKPEPFRRAWMNVNRLKEVLGPEYINAYSLVHSKGMYEGQRSKTDDKRVVNLTRSAYPGQQRYGAITWSGDIEASWDRLRKQIADGLNFTLTGNPKWTLDIGGFFVGENDQWFYAGNYPGGHEDEGYRELYVRWFQFGTFLPMFRSHGTDTPREVWRFGEPGCRTYDTLVKFDLLRYRLLPYIYSLAGWETHRDYTMYRNLAFDFRGDPEVYDISDQFMIGPSLMVCPVTRPMYYGPNSTPIEGEAEAREVYLPAPTEWYDFWTGIKYEGGQTILADAPLEKIPLFVPAGSIIPMGPKVQYAEESWMGTWELRVYGGSNAKFDVYEDAGDGYDYEDGEYVFIPIRWGDHGNELTIKEAQDQFAEIVGERKFNVTKVEERFGTGIEIHEGREIAYDGQEKVMENLNGRENDSN